MSTVRGDTAIDHAPHNRHPNTLTRRQKEILCMLAGGKRIGEIQTDLGISYPAIARHMLLILDRLEARTYIAAVAKALIIGQLTSNDICFMERNLD